MENIDNFNEEVWLALNHLEINDRNIAFFLSVLKETNNKDFWLILPLDLSETHDERLLPILIDLLQDPRTDGCRGNFLTALREYDYLPYSDILIRFVCEGNWELRTKSAQMLLQIKDRLSSDVLYELEKHTKDALNDADDKRQLLCEFREEFGFEIDCTKY